MLNRPKFQFNRKHAVISSGGLKEAGVEKSIMKRFLHFVRPDKSGLTSVEMTSFRQNIEDYLDFYGLKIAAIRHEFVPFKSGAFELAGQVFVPKEYKATVVILHGYLNHCGLLAKLIKYLVEAGFAVAVFDLPGHGLSSGEPTAIDDFSQYSDSLKDFLNIIGISKNVIARSPAEAGRRSNLYSETRDCFAALAMTNNIAAIPKLHGPFHIIGHSTGAAVIVDYLLACTERSRSVFDKVILTAPLERSDWWLLSKIGFSISRRFCRFLPRVFRRVSSDRDFLRFVKYKDPLGAKKISLKWVGAMFRWDEKIAYAPIIDRQVYVVQGKKDNIINWRHNIRFIQSKFSRAEIKLVEKCRHELFNESAQIREKVFLQINNFLNS